MKQTPIIKPLALAAMVAFLIFSSVANQALAIPKATKQKKPLVKRNAISIIDLRKIEQVKEAFQQDRGKVRLVTILSPT